MNKKWIITLTAALALWAVAAPAETRRGQRARNQQARIADGVKDGSLTKREVRKIERKEADLARDAARMRRSGGELTPGEKVRIEKRQDKLSREIYREKHDAQNRK